MSGIKFNLKKTVMGLSLGAGCTAMILAVSLMPLGELLPGQRDSGRENAAARQVLTGQALSTPKGATGPVESLRMLQITRHQLVATAPV